MALDSTTTLNEERCSSLSVRVIVICVATVLAAPGCTLLFGRYRDVDECVSRDLPTVEELERAPIWVPGSPRRASMPATGCVGGDGSHYTDRFCVVGESRGLPSVAQSEVAARQDSLQLLGDELATRMEAALAVLPAPPPSSKIKTFGKQLRNAIGHVTDVWQSPNCNTFAIAEVELADFKLVLKGPALPVAARDELLSESGKIVSSP